MAQSLDGGAHGLRCSAVDSDTRTSVEKGFCNIKADTPTAARYQDALIREIQVVSSRFTCLVTPPRRLTLPPARRSVDRREPGAT